MATTILLLLLLVMLLVAKWRSKRRCRRLSVMADAALLDLRRIANTRAMAAQMRATALGVVGTDVRAQINVVQLDAHRSERVRRQTEVDRYSTWGTKETKR